MGMTNPVLCTHPWVWFECIRPLQQGGTHMRVVANGRAPTCQGSYHAPVLLAPTKILPRNSPGDFPWKVARRIDMLQLRGCNFPWKISVRESRSQPWQKDLLPRPGVLAAQCQGNADMYALPAIRQVSLPTTHQFPGQAEHGKSVHVCLSRD